MKSVVFYYWQIRSNAKFLTVTLQVASTLCYRGENRAMPPRLRYFVYFLDFDIQRITRCTLR